VGKRKQEKMTGLTYEQRIESSVKRKEKEDEMRRKEELELAKATLESSSPTSPTPPPIFDRAMREFLAIERLAEQEKRKKKWLGKVR